MKLDVEMAGELHHPLETVEQYLAEEQIAYERSNDLEIQFLLTGTWCDYPVWYRWLPNTGVLQIGLGIETKIPENREQDVASLLVQINEHLLVGHFDIYSQDRALVFRHGQLFEQGQMAHLSLVQKMIHAAMEAAEVMVPALNFLLWSDKTASEAVAAAMFETVGEA
ncbi:hypothetical protein MNBD_ALPHA06-1038 [hydrothermal vent metagenome]|uniref:YbjN domain-containing protein n=1 Tax=hydrothermal vent metagenome TaxID=652676 RepID=A0A3B0R5U3_9ZZZZ